MTTLRIALIAAAAAIVGGLLGAFIAARFTGSLIDYGTAVASLATITVEGSALEKIQAGDLNGAQLVLNRRIDGELLNLKNSVDEGFKLPSHGVEALARVKRVRRATGYVPSEQSMRDGVESALALTGAKNE